MGLSLDPASSRVGPLHAFQGSQSTSVIEGTASFWKVPDKGRRWPSWAMCPSLRHGMPLLGQVWLPELLSSLVGSAQAEPYMLSPERGRPLKEVQAADARKRKNVCRPEGGWWSTGGMVGLSGENIHPLLFPGGGRVHCGGACVCTYVCVCEHLVACGTVPGTKRVGVGTTA